MVHAPSSKPIRRGNIAVVGFAAGLPISIAGVLGVAYFAMAALPPLPVPPENPITEQKRILGKVLFWDEQLSATNTVACATCHIPARAGTDPRIARHSGPDNLLNTPDDKLASPGVVRSDDSMGFVRDVRFGVQPQITDRTAMSMINAAYAPQLFWDGRASGQFLDPETGQVLIANRGALESQAAGPPLSSVEMGHDGIDWSAVKTKLETARPLELAANMPSDVATALNTSPDYPELFRRAFGTPEISAARISMALATYQRTLLSDQAPWDRFVAGDSTALSAAAQRGLNVFQGGGARCNVCHTASLFTDNTFRNIGLRPPAEDLGRQIVTGNPNDRGRFKVPSLRNVALKSSFMHHGQISTLADVIRFYARAPGAPQQFPDNRDPIIPQINIPPQAAADLEVFLREGLTDPRVANQTFPFDRPTLASEQAARRATLVGGGTAGSGGIVPGAIVDMPGLIGTREYRVGVDRAFGGSTAVLVMSFAPPANGRINADRVLATTVVPGAGNGAGPATVKFTLPPWRFSDGQVAFMQWRIADAGAAGGTALSTIARVPMFCGATGCLCPADFNLDRTGDFFDYLDFVDAFSNERPEADYNGDGSVDFFDYLDFVAAFSNGC
jgi:cytochrome c peroxidase